MKAVDIYINLRKEIEAYCSYLHEIHESEMKCKKQCSSCCVNLTVYPVEFHGLQKIAIKDNSLHADIFFDTEKPCGFLKDDLCQIYKIRPLICMTHGLPVLYYDEESITHNISHCELNFTDSLIKFTEKNTIPLDQINEKIYLINKRFIDEESLSIEPDDRIHLKDIIL